ncbi:MAG TPA: hypothetical protein VFU31_30380 [Candidatus Binatia bacterium]|nr:hypothetical protein [Candidatus Binatia bacterium]
MTQKILFAFVGLWTAVLYSPSVIHACSVCLTGDRDATTDAFNWSVIFLMSTPYLVVSSIAGLLFYSYRRSAAQQETESASEPGVTKEFIG